MIHHNPEVQEKLEQFGIPVMVERSSYESHPLGRTEWMKLYAVLLGKEDVAEKAFKEQTDKLDKVLASDDKDTGKTVAFFLRSSLLHRMKKECQSPARNLIIPEKSICVW